MTLTTHNLLQEGEGGEQQGQQEEGQQQQLLYNCGCEQQLHSVMGLAVLGPLLHCGLVSSSSHWLSVTNVRFEGMPCW